MSEVQPLTFLFVFFRCQPISKAEQTPNENNKSFQPDVVIAAQSEPVIPALTNTPLLIRTELAGGESLERFDNTSDSPEVRYVTSNNKSLYSITH